MQHTLPAENLIATLLCYLFLDMKVYKFLEPGTRIGFGSGKIPSGLEWIRIRKNPFRIQTDASLSSDS